MEKREPTPCERVLTDATTAAEVENALIQVRAYFQARSCKLERSKTIPRHVCVR